MGSPALFIDQCPELATLPQLYNQLREAINKPNCTTGVISRIISSDAALTARVLRVANSAYYGFPQEISSIPQCILIIGTQQLSDLVLSSTVVSHFKLRSPQLDPLEFWKYNIACGLASRILAKKAGIKASERLFIAALLHSVGRMFHAQASPKLYAQCSEIAASGEVTFHEAERFPFGHETSELSKVLLERWNIPQAIRDIACNALTPENSVDHRSEALLLNLARSLVAACRIGSNGEFLIPPPAPAVNELNLAAGALEHAAQELESQLNEVVSSLLD